MPPPQTWQRSSLKGMAWGYTSRDWTLICTSLHWRGEFSAHPHGCAPLDGKGVYQKVPPRQRQPEKTDGLAGVRHQRKRRPYRNNGMNLSFPSALVQCHDKGVHHYRRPRLPAGIAGRTPGGDRQIHSRGQGKIKVSMERRGDFEVLELNILFPDQH